MNILLIEDNDSIIKGLKYAFIKNNYNFTSITTIKESINYINNNIVDLIILDITLPDGNGFNLYKEVISKKNIPTIFLTALDNEDDIVNGLTMGADDYITKPFSTKELLARVNKIILRNKKNNIINLSNIKYDLDKMELYKDNIKVDLSPLELQILNLLFININKVVTRNILLDKIWECTGNYVSDHTITVYLKRIREKIGDNIICTVKGIGYRIDEK